MILENLFWAVIANSGSVMANWALDTEPVAHATSLAKLANCSGTVQDMGTCLTGISVYKLKAAFYAFTVSMMLKPNHLLIDFKIAMIFISFTILHFF